MNYLVLSVLALTVSVHTHAFSPTDLDVSSPKSLSIPTDCMIGNKTSGACLAYSIPTTTAIQETPGYAEQPEDCLNWDQTTHTCKGYGGDLKGSIHKVKTAPKDCEEWDERTETCRVYYDERNSAVLGDIPTSDIPGDCLNWNETEQRCDGYGGEAKEAELIPQTQNSIWWSRITNWLLALLR